MNKSVLAALAFAGLSLAGTNGASAQSATQTINLNAFVNALCTINGSATGAAGETGTVVTSGTTAPAGTVTLPSADYAVVCSTPNNVTITSLNDGIKANTLGGGTNYINYTATVTQGVTTSSLTTLGTGVLRTSTAGLTPTAYTGNMLISVATAATTGLTPGSYADTLTVTLTPQ